MRFNIFVLPLLLAMVLTFGACGQKPERKLPNKALEYFSKNAGCLNDLGPHIDKLLVGDISSGELDRTSLCLTESLTLFKRYIKGTYPDGYSPDDIRAFVSEFLMTDKTITLELVQKVFELKASVFGGTKEKLSRAEVDRFIGLIEALRSESEKLVPLLKLRSTEPTAKNLLALADALSLATFRLSSQVGGLEYPAFTIASAQELTGEIGKLFGWKVRPADAYWIFSAKSIFVGGENHQIESRNWPVALQTGGHLGGLMLAYRSQQGTDYDLNRELLDRVFSYLSGFTISFDQVDHLIDALPNEAIPPLLGKSMLKWGIQLAVVHLFGGNQFDSDVFSRIHGFASPILAREAYLAGIFWGLNDEGTSTASFVRAARNQQYGMSGQERQRVEELIFLAQRFNPMFTHSDDKQITLVRGLALTRHHLQQLSWIRSLTELLVGVYGQNGSVSQEGFNTLMSHFGDFGFQMGKLDITVDKYQEKRFREANLFMPVSNGDAFIDLDEGTYFVSYLVSSGGLSERVMGTLATSCKPQGPWFMGYRHYEVACARRAFFDNFERHWDHLPGLRDHYAKLDEAKRRKLESDYERGARPKGKSENPISYSDVQGLSTIAHYVESLMLRADVDGNGVINLAEAMTIYPVFRPLLIKGGALDPNDEAMVEAVFTYMMKYKRPPQKTPAGLIHFLLWKVMKKHWKLNDDRSDLFTIIGTLADIQNGRPTEPGNRGF